MPVVAAPVVSAPWGSHHQATCGKDVEIDGARVTKVRGQADWDSAVMASSIENPSSFTVKIIKRGETESFMIGLVDKPFFEPNASNVKTGYFLYCGTKTAFSKDDTNRHFGLSGELLTGTTIEFQYDRFKGTIAVVIGGDEDKRYEAFSNVRPEGDAPLCPCVDFYDVGASVELTDFKI